MNGVSELFIKSSQIDSRFQMGQRKPATVWTAWASTPYGYHQCTQIEDGLYTASSLFASIKNRDTPKSYHGYWPSDPTNIDTRFGTEEDLMDLSDQLHNRGMYLMVDWVINHFSLDTGPDDADYGVFPSPWNTAEAFHPPCDIDYSNQTSVEWCWFSTSNQGSLPDVYTEKPTIFNPLVESVETLVTKYNIDGIRLDTAKYMPKEYLQQFQDAVGVFVMGEVADGNYDYVADYQKYLDSTLNYALFYNLQQSIPQNKTLDNVGYGMYYINKTNVDPTILGNFLDNHDQARIASWTGEDEFKDANAVTFIMFHSGIPIVYYGFEQRFNGAADPNNREMMWTSNYDTSTSLYQYISKLQQIRAMAADLSGPSFYDQSTTANYTDAHTLVFERGKLVIVINNVGSSGNAQTNVNIPNTQYSRGQILVDLISCQTVTVIGCTGGFYSAAAPDNLPRVSPVQATIHNAH
ncbi:MAG: hypothetical protein Q9227_001625 [Pyrenula ochraceoflavens]